VVLRSGGFNVASNYHSWDLQLDGRYALMADQKLNPYAIIGLGVGQVIETAGYSGGGQGSGTVGGSSPLSFTYSVGIGADYAITDNILAGLEARFQEIACANTFSKDSHGGGFSLPADDNIKIAAKIGYKFGGK
jgi:opacity protein-like surface antigen